MTAIGKRDRREKDLPHHEMFAPRVSHRQKAIFDAHNEEKRGVSDESRKDGFDFNRKVSSTCKQLKNEVSAAIDQHWHFASRIKSLLTLKMKTITSFSTFILLLQFAALPCSARSGRRASPPALENTLSLSNLNSLNGSLAAGPADPNLQKLSKVPYDEKIGSLTLRITRLKNGPLISSYNLLPCMVETLSTAFDAVWNAVERHPQLHDGNFMCSANALHLQVRSHKPQLKKMEYSDLVTLAEMVLNFQQVYRLTGIEFDYLEDGQKKGVGEIGWNYESLEQE